MRRAQGGGRNGAGALGAGSLLDHPAPASRPAAATSADGTQVDEHDSLLARHSVRMLYALVWVVFLLFPLIEAINSRDSPIGLTCAIVAVAAFVGVYFLQLFRAPGQVPVRIGLTMVGLQLAIAITLALAERYAWVSMFTFTVAGAAFVLPSPLRRGPLLLSGVLIPGIGLLDRAPASYVLAYTATTIGVGILMLVLSDLRARNGELSAARAELARLAVAKERLRFARDLHDLLGHSLSVIALKSELAGRLIAARPAEAVDEVRSVERVAREALAEVREAVSGYRQPTLDGELEGARMALAAAGIQADLQRARVTLDPAVEATLAWAVREGATNVIRHSGASRCAMRVSASLGDAAVEVVDDGVGAAAAGDGLGAGASDGTAAAAGNGNGGHGLAGLQERAQGLRGRLETGPAPEGGFRLLVTVPVATR